MSTQNALILEKGHPQICSSLLATAGLNMFLLGNLYCFPIMYCAYLLGQSKASR